MFKSIRVATSKSATTVRTVLQDEVSKLPKSARQPGFKGESGEVTFANDVLYLGLGEKKTISNDQLRKAGAGLVKSIDRMSIRAVSLDVKLSASTVDALGGSGMLGRALAEGVGLANWRVDFFDGTASKRDAPQAGLSIHADDRAVNEGLKRGLILAESTNYARRIASTPPNICNPEFMAREARRLAREKNITCKVIGFDQARKMGMGGIVNVGKASSTKPRLIQLEYTPNKGTRSGQDGTIVLVGKTITYDTGGYSLKISNGMKGMKYDKNGGMAILGAMHAIASLKLPLHVVALLPTAENMVGGDAYRPDDIITMYNGVTVEVTNTDAEGRLVLADALAYACDKLKPKAIIDMATLTGGVVVALGSWSAGLFCEHDALRERIYAAANSSGEMVWRLPLWEKHREFMRSKHADVWNSGPKRDGHPIQGAAFLSYFVDPEIPWAHIDIAGTSAVDADSDLYVQGPTGYGVRLLADLVAAYAR